MEPNKLKKIRFDSFVSLNRGFDLPDNKIIEGKYPVIASTSIKAYHNQYKVKAPIVVTGRSGSLGKVQYADSDGWPLNTALYAKNFHGNDPKYVYYFLQTMHLEQYNAGAGVPTLNQNHLHSLKILVHNLPTQRRIASILSTYDALIQNYKRQIAALQSAANELYKEWFVRFRFPGYKNAKFDNGLPVGWKVEKLFDIAKIIYGFPFNSDKFCNDSTLKPVVRIRDIIDNHTNTYTNEDCDEKYWINPNELLIGMDGIFHMTLWTGERALQNQRTVRLTSNRNNLSNYFLYFSLYPQIKALEQMIVGTTVAHLGDKHLKKITVLIPNEKILVQSFNQFETIQNQIYLLQQQIINLTTQRDLLLPRLMSGKLSME